MDILPVSLPNDHPRGEAAAPLDKFPASRLSLLRRVGCGGLSLSHLGVHMSGWE